MGNLRFLALVGCFALSGLAALVYQTAWSEEFALVFGASHPASAAVLAATMAGLAAGAAAAARFEARVARPLTVYALLELAVGLSALAVPAATRGVGTVQRALLAGRAEDGAAATLLAVAAALLILLIPNALMGATLPVMARWAVRSAAELGPRVAALVAANTAGAAAGALLCPFLLVPRLGLGAATVVAAAVSLAVGTVALCVARDERLAACAVARPPIPVGPRAPAGSWVLPAILVSGAVSLTYEVVWTRLLGHLLGGSAYAFGTMLASFLSGLAVGSAAAARFTASPAAARRAFACAQLATAAATLLAYATLDRLPALLVALTPDGGAARPAVALIGAALMFPGAVAIGATFPLAVRIVARDAEAGAASARVLAWNTVGSIVGAIATGFLLLPTLGFTGTVTLAVAANLVLAAASAVAARPRLRLAGAAAVGLATVLAVAPPAVPWTLLRSSPVAAGVAEGEVTFLAVGRTATVLVLDAGSEWRLSTDGMPEAAIDPLGARPGRQPITGWLALLPLAARPDAQTMLVIGLGGGSTLEEIPPSVREVTVVELEPEVVRANRRLAEGRRRDPLADPRLRVVVNDARSFLRLTDRRFDVVVSQPSHPWTAGASHLFTREMFELARERLEPGGVFVQWIGLNLVDLDTLSSLLATLGSVFTHVETFCPEPGVAALFVASNMPLRLDAAAAAEAVATTPAWAGLGVPTGGDLLLARVLDAAGSAHLARGATLTTDHHNLLGARSPWLVQRPLAPSLAAIAAAWGPLDPLPHTAGIDRLAATARLLDQGSAARALRVAAAVEDRVERETAFAVAALARGDGRRGQSELVQLARANPQAAAPVRALVRWWQRELRSGAMVPGLAPLVAADEIAATVVEGWRRQAAGDLAGVAALDGRLSSLGPGDVLYPATVRLRVAWRQATGEPAHARAALDLLDPLLAMGAPVQDLLLRARLGRAAGDEEVVLTSLAEVAAAARGHRQLGPAVRSALAILDGSRGSAAATSVGRVRRLLEQAEAANGT